MVGRIQWGDIVNWESSAVNDAALTVLDAKKLFDESSEDLESAARNLEGTGEAVNSLDARLGRESTRASLMSALLNRVLVGLNEATDSVADVSRVVGEIETHAAACRMNITGHDGRVRYSVSLQTDIELERQRAAVQGLLRMARGPIGLFSVGAAALGGSLTPIADKAKIDKELLEQRIRELEVLATQVDNELTDLLRSSGNDQALSAGSFDTSGTTSANSASPYSSSDQSNWPDAPAAERTISFHRELAADESFPPPSVTLEPNTRYEVTQEGGFSRGYYYTDDTGAVTFVEANASRDKNDPLNFDLREPQPNTTYRVDTPGNDGATTYITDEFSRTETVLIDDLDDSVKGDRHGQIQSGVGHEGTYWGGEKDGREPKLYDYNGGHQVASQYGGIREEINLTPQLADVNQANSNADAARNGPNYGRLENMWRSELRDGHDVDVVVTNVYDSELQDNHELVHTVPTTVMVDYSSNGSQSTFNLDNTPNGPRYDVSR